MEKKTGVGYGVGRYASARALHSCSQVYAFLLETWCLVGGFPGVLAYDDACHLSKYVLNGVRFCVDNVNVLQRGFARFTQFVVDPFHFPNHKDQDYCKEFMDPGKVEAAKGVNMEVRAACDKPGHAHAFVRRAAAATAAAGASANLRLCVARVLLIGGW